MQGDVISVEKIINATPKAIFDLVADAAKHPVIDGSGTVIEAKSDAPQRLSLGCKFGMSMKLGIGYSMSNTVIEFEEDRRIAWQARPNGMKPIARFFAGRIWRYELEPVEGGTLVRESWDISKDGQKWMLRLGGLPEKTRSNMERTLERIAEVTAS